MSIVDVAGLIVLWILAGGMIAAYPLTEFARGMATAPSEHGRSRGGCVVSLLGLALAALLVGGCSTPTVTRVETVEVKVPVAVQPIRPDQVPAAPRPLQPRPDSLSAAADVLLAKVCEWVAYGVRADPLLRISAGEKAGTVPLYPECEASR